MWSSSGVAVEEPILFEAWVDHGPVRFRDLRHSRLFLSIFLRMVLSVSLAFS